MKKNSILLLLIAVLMSFGSSAQFVTQYTRTALTGQTYTSISSGTSLNSAVASNADDNAVAVTLPFTFNYDAVGYTTVTMSTNGWLAMGNQASLTGANASTLLYNTATPNSTIGVFLGDINSNVDAGYPGLMQHGSVGTGIYAFEWKQASVAGYNPSTTNLISMMIKLYGPASSNPGRIELCYGASTGTPFADPNGGSPAGWSAGIEDATGGSGRYIEASTGSTTTTASMSGWPGNGVVYRFDPPVFCGGTPTPGNTLSNAGLMCTATNFTLSVQNATPGVNTTYQWQSSPNNSTWTNIAGATNPTLTTTQSATTWYRLQVKCGSNTGNSTPVRVVTLCYCAGTNTNGCGTGAGITNVTLNTLSSYTGCASTTGATTDFGGTKGITNLSQGKLYSISVTGDAGGAMTFMAWIDYNQNGTFDASEAIGLPSYNSASTTVYTVATNMMPPLNALQGYTKMRVRSRSGTAITSADACTTFTDGETEDYDVNIVCETPTVSTLPTNTIVCPGNNAVFTSAAMVPGATYQWQVSTDGGTTWTNVANNANYSGAATNILTVTGINAPLHNTKYRLVATSLCSTTVNTSNVSTLILNSLPSVSVQPTDQVTCATKNATFSVTATGGLLSYQWYVSTDGGVTYSAVTNTGVYSGATTNTLTITAATVAMNNYKYYAALINSCYVASTAIATLTVHPLIAFTTNPTTTNICPNAAASFTAAATGVGITYQWQESTDAGATWNNLSNAGIYSGVTTGTLNISSAPLTMNNYRYRLMATSTVSCATATPSSSATLFVNGAVTITTHPATKTVCEFISTTFTAATSSSGSVYTWQQSPDNGVTWNTLTNTAPYSGVATATLTINPVALTMNGYQYRVFISNPCNPGVNSNVATMTVQQAPVVTTQPLPVTVCDGTIPSSATFTVAAIGANVTYQWQVSTDAGANWSNVANGIRYVGVTTTSLTVNNPPASFNGYLYRAAVSGTCAPVANSNAVALTVNTRPVITSHPASVVICPGDAASFTVAALATGITYQWQSLNGSTWTNLTNGGGITGATSATLGIAAPTTAQNLVNGYRVIITGTCTAPVTSNVATHFVSTAPVITAQPVDKIACFGNTTLFSVGATATTPNAAGITYRWQVSTDGGANWANVAAAAPHSTVTTAQLTITATPLSVDNNQYRCVITTQCGTVTSAAARISVSKFPPLLGGQPQNVTVCPGKQPKFSVSGTGTGLLYQWQVNTGSGFANIPTTSPDYSDVKASQMTVNNAKVTMNGYTFRCVVSGDCTPTVTSNSALLTVLNPVTIVSQAVSDTACETTTTRIGLTAAGGALRYQWQIQTSPGFYTNLFNTSTYSGVNTDSLRISNVPFSLSGSIYRCYITENVLCNLDFYSADIPLFVHESPMTSPSTLYVIENDNATYSVPNTASSYQWQENANNTGFADLVDTNKYKGITTNTLTILDVSLDMDNYRYRCIVDGVCYEPMGTKPALLVVGGVSVNKIKGQDVTMKVYPNPLSGTQLNINFSKVLNGKTEVRVLDKLGKLVYQGVITQDQSNTASIELNALAAGSYMLQISNETDRFTKTVQFTKQ